MHDDPPSNDALLDWRPRGLDPFDKLSGAHVSITPFRAERDAEDFFRTLCAPGNAGLWKYLPFDPFTSPQNVCDFVDFVTNHDNWTCCMIRDLRDDSLLGTASFMRVRPDAGSAEVGFVLFSPILQRSTAATEAMYLMARHVLHTSGYRRYEWKCNNDNQASRNAALRLGFTFEGVFRQDMVVAGRNRDTAWFSLLDREWPVARQAFEIWLDAGNFTTDGAQKRSLAEIRERR